MRPSVLAVAAVLSAGVAAISFGSIFVRLASQSAGDSGVAFSLVMSALRMLFASLFLLPAWQGLRRLKTSANPWPFALGAGAFLALHFATWITSLGLTSIAASTVLVTSTPIWMALLAWLWLGLAPNRLTLLAIGIALGGAVVVALADSGGAPAPDPPLGNLLALCGAVAAAAYLLLGREAQRRGLPIGVYIATAYTTAALLLLPLPWLLGGGYLGYPPLTYLWIALMALFPQLIGHTSLNWAMRHAHPVLVSLVALLEPVGASLLALLIFAEVPSVQVVWGGLLLLAGVGLAVLGNSSREKAAAEEGP
ncbi:EamA family transporter [Meiothermus sp. QL-1]|uniref:DMT family transporter n=1 Tax=Meiothermus sp. QL-1 TaxID=2058095 RepID=UPI000E0C941A|nr:DMT family transporter [Meiothermus sp. QL-1]RDI95020.1 EamA family transporter [Meiothermus sp. QL-1]